MESNCNIQVEVVYATSKFQKIVNLTVNQGCTIREVILASECFDGIIETTPVGIFGKRRSLDHVLKDGDRVEIYSPLFLDPKQARKERAKKSKKFKQPKRRKN